MPALAGNAEREPVLGLVALATGALLMTAGVFTALPLSYGAVATAFGVTFALAHQFLLRWDVLLAGMLLVILFIPIKRYGLPASLPFDLEPYRLFVGLILLGWVASLLIDPEVRLRRTGFEAPLGLIVIATLGSEVANGKRVSELQPYVVKALLFFASFLLVTYLIASVVRDRETLTVLIKVLVGGGAVVAVFALIERRTSFNVFDHLESFVPLLSFNGASEAMRGGDIRATASAQHPIALGVALGMLVPFSVYLARATGRYRWWVAAVILVMATLATGSRTAIVGLAVVGLVFLLLRPSETLRLWPAVIPALVVIHLALPGALGSIRAGFFPEEGLIAEQSKVVPGNELMSNNRIADWGPALTEFAQHNPLVGQGFGTRVTGFDAAIVNAAILDNQWLKTMLETGVVGLLGWIWLFVLAIRRLARDARADTSREGWLPVALVAGLASFAVSMVTYDVFSFIQVTFLIFILLGLSAVFLRLNQAPRSPRAESRRF